MLLSISGSVASWQILQSLRADSSRSGQQQQEITDASAQRHSQSNQTRCENLCCGLWPVLCHVLQVYGSYYRKLSKRVQAALAEANAVAEEVLSAMATVSAKLIGMVRCLMGASLDMLNSSSSPCSVHHCQHEAACLAYSPSVQLG